MAADEINAAGGIKAGRDIYKLDVIANDDKANPTEATNAVRKLIDRDGVKYLLGFCCSGATSAVASFIGKENAVMLVGNAAERSITTKNIPNLFRTRPPADFTGAAAGTFVGPQGSEAHRRSRRARCRLLRTVCRCRRTRVQEGRRRDHRAEVFSLKDRDMTPQLTKIRGLNPDAILVVGYVEPAAFVYRQAIELGMNVPRYGFTSGSEEQFLRVTTSRTDGRRLGPAPDRTDPAFGAARTASPITPITRRNSARAFAEFALCL